MSTISRPIYEYEVQLRAKKNGETKLVTLRQHAYSVMDAYMQAFMITCADGSEATLVSIGPPEDAIRAASEQLAEELRLRMEQLIGPTAIDAVGTTGGKATVSRKI